MHILLAILAVAGGIGIWIWRAQLAARASGDLIETADDIRAALRRFGYRRKANVNLPDGIQDPRLSAASPMHSATLSIRPPVNRDDRPDTLCP